MTGELDTISQSATVLADYAYDDLGNRTGVSFANGVTQGYGYDPVSRLASLSNNLTDTNDLSVTFAYNPASQIIQTVRSGDAYAFTNHPSQNKAGVANGLNQLTSIGGAATAHDARGNLTTDPTTGKTYTYSSENLLKTAIGGVALGYDPAMRLYEITGTSTTRFMYDGLDSIAEFDGSNALQRRYVFGPGIDNPIVQYEGTGTTDRRFMSADERGSIISITDSAGALLNINRYDEYGKPSAANVGRFQYTGQAWIPELGLYYYKARFYAPHLGRFMQPDPIGYADSPNLYNYVLGDPVNLVDPLGLEAVCTDCNGPINVVGQRLTYVWWPRMTQIIIGDVFGVVGEGGSGGGNGPQKNKGCPTGSIGEIRRNLPSKGVVDQISDGVSSYIQGVAWGGTALAAGVGLLGSNAKQQAISTNRQLGQVLDQISSHPGQTSSFVGAVASKYPVQLASRVGSGVIVSIATTPYVGVPVTGLAAYGNAFKTAYQHPNAVAAAVIVGESCL